MNYSAGKLKNNKILVVYYQSCKIRLKKYLNTNGSIYLKINLKYFLILLNKLYKCI